MVKGDRVDTRVGVADGTLLVRIWVVKVWSMIGFRWRKSWMGLSIVSMREWV